MPDALQAAEDSVWWTLFPQGTDEMLHDSAD